MPGLNTVHVRRAELSCVLVVTCAGLLISLQGWKSRSPTLDLVPHILDAESLVQEGTIPVRGTLSSLRAYTPPGTTWLLAPGLLLTDDPRLFEFAGSATLYFATLLGTLFLARAIFGVLVGCLAVALFGLSDLGVFFAGSLWPRGHPFFFVWMAYWLHRWISANSARSLAVALVFWAAGMYVFMEIAPAALLVPVLWLVYRPPIRLASLTIALVASVSLWWPYLLYQRTRDFQDLHALLSRTPLYASGVPANVRQPWCDERLPMEGGGGTSGNLSVDVATMADAERGLLVRTVDFGYGALQKWHAMLGNAVRGMTRSLVPATLTATVALCLASVVSLLALALGSPRMRHWALSRPTVQQPAWCTGLGVAFLAIGLSAGVLLPRLLSRDGSLDPATRDTLFGLQIDILIVSAVFLGFRFLRLALHRLAEAMAIGPGPSSANHLFIALEHF